MRWRPPTPAPRAAGVAIVLAAGLVVLGVLVHLGLTRSVDAVIRQWTRPDDVWGPLQMRVDLLVEGLRPAMTLPITGAVAAAASLVRRSARPLVATAAACLVMVVVTVGVKLVLHRPDPHGAISDHGGSFPSGHTTTLVTCAGLLTLLLATGRRWWRWLPPLVLGSLMGAALLVQAAHWFTDVIGGGLTGAAVLATVAALGLDEWLRSPRGVEAGRSVGATSAADRAQCARVGGDAELMVEGADMSGSMEGRRDRGAAARVIE